MGRQNQTGRRCANGPPPAQGGALHATRIVRRLICRLHPTKGKRDSRKLMPTKTPGIYKRGSPYVVVYRAGGSSAKELHARSTQARAIKRAREADRDRGEFQALARRWRLRDYLSSWVESYQGHRQARLPREHRGTEYRRLLDSYAHGFFGQRLRLTVRDAAPSELIYVRWLADPSKHEGKRLSDSSIANAVVPVRAALRPRRSVTGLIRLQPGVTGWLLPHAGASRRGRPRGSARGRCSRSQLDALAEPSRRKRYAAPRRS